MYVIGWTPRLEGEEGMYNGLWCPKDWDYGRWPDDLALARRFKDRQSAQRYTKAKSLDDITTILELDEAETWTALAAL